MLRFKNVYLIPVITFISLLVALYLEEDTLGGGKEDYEYQIRLLKKTGGKLLILKDDLVIYRITNSNASMDISKYINTLNVIEFYKINLW